jgi:hypothetical protein
MTTVLVVLVALLILSASLAGLAMFRAKVQGFRLLLIAPVPAALAVGIFAIAYFLSYAGDYIAVSLFVSLVTLGAWIIGIAFCALAVLFSKWLSRPW